MLQAEELAGEEYKKRMEKILEELKIIGDGHDPEGSQRTRLQIKEWIHIPASLVLIADKIPNPANTLIINDPGYLTALAVIFGETRFWICEDCRCPIPDCNVNPTDFECTPVKECPICGDQINFIKEKLYI